MLPRMNYSTLSEALAAEVRAEVARQRISLGELAANMSISLSTLQRRLYGTHTITTDELAEFSACLNVGPEVLMSRAVMNTRAAS